MASGRPSGSPSPFGLRATDSATWVKPEKPPPRIVTLNPDGSLPYGVILPGEPAPAFSCASHAGATVSLSDYAGKRLVLWFFPKASTPG